MSERYSPGGLIRSRDGASVLATLHDDECVWNREGVCVRTDTVHHRVLHDVPPRLGSPGGWMWGPCLHRHPVPVESVVTGEVLAHLCPACNEQLP